MVWFLRLAAVPLALLAAPLVAQDSPSPTAASTAPDPATITLPQITGGRDEQVVRDGWKFFYFWRAGTTFEQAYADFADCYRFLPPSVGNMMVPSFVAWQGPEGLDRVEPVYNTQFGLVGALIGAALASPNGHRAAKSRMRRCMEPRGYQRFPMPEETWEQIVDDFSPGAIGVIARLASGPRPDADPLPQDR